MSDPSTRPVPPSIEFDPAIAARIRGSKSTRDTISEYKRSIGALLMRETVTRFGSRSLGYLWAFVEPIGFIMVFVILRSFAAEAIPFGDNLVLFMLSGLVAARTTMNLIGKMAAAITSNKALLTYPMIQPLDAVIARMILEGLTMIMIILVFYVGLAIYLDALFINDYADFTAATLAALYLGISWGAFNAALIPLVPTYGTLFNIVRLPLLLTSAIFFVPAQLGPSIKAILWWNPILHIVEWYRDAIYISYIPLLDRSYPVAFSTLLLVAALWMERTYRLRIATG